MLELKNISKTFKLYVSGYEWSIDWVNQKQEAIGDTIH